MTLLRARNVLLLILAVLLAAPLLLMGAVYACMWRSRFEASRIATCARGLQPGVTTQAAFLKAVRPFSKNLSHGREGEAGKPEITTDFYGVTNYPRWFDRLMSHTPEALGNWLFRHHAMRGSVFSISPRFVDGRLSVLQVEELQDGVDGIHPFAAIVALYAQRYEKGEVRLEGRSFLGYEVDRYETVEEDSQGNAIGKPWLTRQYVNLDERATAEERKRALNFDFGCFTSFKGFQDADSLLHPVPVP